ncbi:MAG: response regulator [Panacibacter sp.]
MKGKILIYDDESEILLLCKAILSRYDFLAETFSRCENIIHDIELIQPQLILMDLWIPEIGGEKAITLIKQHERSKNIPFLFFSAHPDIKDISEKAKTDGFIEKPFTVKSLIETIQKHLS